MKQPETFIFTPLKFCAESAAAVQKVNNLCDKFHVQCWCCSILKKLKCSSHFNYYLLIIGLRFLQAGKS